MFVLMMIAVVITMAQLAVVTAPSRSIRFTTLVALVCCGLYCCGPATILLEMAWTRATAGWHGGVRQAVDVASWSVDPVLEEVVKVLPLLVFAIVARRASQHLGLADWLVAGAALGAGFELMESGLRYSTVGSTGSLNATGWTVAAGLFGVAIVPHPWVALVTWLPGPVVVDALLSDPDYAHHLVWSALAGLGIGWWVRRRDPWRWAGWVPLVVVSLAHLNYNFLIAGDADSWARPLARAFEPVTEALGGVLVVALLLAVIADRIALRQGYREAPALLFPAESEWALSLTPLLRRARRRAPASVWSTWQFELGRRAAAYATAAQGASEPLVTALAGARESLDAPPSGGRDEGLGLGWGPPQGWRDVVLNWRFVLWCVALAPAFAYLFVGGFPATRGLQRLFVSEPGKLLLMGAAAVMVVLLVMHVSRLGGALRHAPVGPTLPETRGLLWVRLATALGVITTGVLLVAMGLTLRPSASVVMNAHALEALSRALFVLALALLLAGLVFFPPFALAATTAGTVVVVPAVSSGLVASTVGATALAGLGLVLNEAAEASEGSGAGSSSGSKSAKGTDWRAGDGAASPQSGRPSFQDPAQSPGPGWEWRGPGQPGSDRGGWFNPKTGETLHPDLNHPPGIRPHWDYIPSRGHPGFRLFEDGTWTPR